MKAKDEINIITEVHQLQDVERSCPSSRDGGHGDGTMTNYQEVIAKLAT